MQHRLARPKLTNYTGEFRNGMTPQTYASDLHANRCLSAEMPTSCRDFGRSVSAPAFELIDQSVI